MTTAATDPKAPAARLAVDLYVQRIAIKLTPEDRRQALQLEVDRLDALQAAFWTTAIKGDRHAADVVLKVIARRCKVLGFDKPDESTAPVPRTSSPGASPVHRLVPGEAGCGRCQRS
jgi:hypothetical protein